MSDQIVIKSLFREYILRFVDNFEIHLHAEAQKDSFFVIDRNIYKLFHNKIIPHVHENRLILIEANEKNKSLNKCHELIEYLVDKGMRRNERLVAVGGGIIQDVTAFSASILYRGVEWVFFPTTLLAQADSCIGSKTSINLGDKKNLIGNFYPPSEIYIDLAFLDTLDIDDIKSGIGEMMHFYFYKQSATIEKISHEYDSLLANRALLKGMIIESLTIKKSVIEHDEFDREERNKFNYGHTFGHALETVSNYTIKHGQAVTVGMDIANYLSWKYGMIDESEYRNRHSIMWNNFPQFDWSLIDVDAYKVALSKDKKNIGSKIGCILLNSSGKLEKRTIDNDNQLKYYMSGYLQSL